MKVVEKLNKYCQRHFIISLVWYMRISQYNFSICIVNLALLFGTYKLKYG